MHRAAAASLPHHMSVGLLYFGRYLLDCMLPSERQLLLGGRVRSRWSGRRRAVAVMAVAYTSCLLSANGGSWWCAVKNMQREARC